MPVHSKDKPLIDKELVVAVLPFEINSKEDGLIYFSKGFTEDLIINLSRFKSLQIISSHSSKLIDSSDDTASEMINQLDAAYIVKGSFRTFKNDLSLSFQLVDAQSERIVWADKHSGSTEEIFSIQEEIAEKLVAILEKRIRVDLLYNVRNKNIGNLKSYECYLRGMDKLDRGSLEEDVEARMFFEKALD